MRIYKLGNDVPFIISVSAGSSVTVTHGLGYKPYVWFEDTSGYALDVTNYSVKHNSVNEFEVDFGTAVTLTIHYI